MNLFAASTSVITAVQPLTCVRWQRSTGYAVDGGGNQVPAYAPARELLTDAQPLQYNDIQMASGLNVQGVRQKLYFSGEANGLVRVNSQGGDLFTFPDGSVWKVAFVAEQWAQTWCTLVVTLQNGT